MFALFKKKEERKIYEFWDGERTRRVDPMEIWMSLQEHEDFLIDKTPQDADNDDPEAQKLLCKATQEAFGIKPYHFNGKEVGLTMVETMNLYSEYCNWLDGLKKNTVA